MRFLLMVGGKECNLLSMKEFFSKLGLIYRDTLGFSSATLRDKIKDAWLGKGDKNWLGICFEEELKKRSFPKVQIVKKDSLSGYGLVTKEVIGTHRLVGEYTGIVRKRSLSMIFRNEYCALYPTGFSTLRTYVIDASHEGNEMRFINHSNKPNIEMRSTLCSDGLIHIVFIAKRVIHKEEELTLNYGSRFWWQLFKRPHA